MFAMVLHFVDFLYEELLLAESQHSALSEDYHWIIFLVRKSCPTLSPDPEDFGDDVSKQIGKKKLILYCGSCLHRSLRL